MSKCDRIINPGSICGDSALDAVTRLVVEGWQLQTACKFVANEYQKTYPEDNAKWSTLKKSYQRANPTKKKDEVKKAPPVVDNSTTTNSTTTMVDPFPLQAKIGALEQKVSELEKTIKELYTTNADLADKVIMYEAAEHSGGKPQNFPTSPTPAPQESSVAREAAIAAISEYGNSNQRTALTTDSLSTNKHLYNMIKLIRERMLETMPPQSLPKVIRDCQEVVD